MYLIAHASTVIDCPRHIAFEYVADLEHFAKWFPGVLGIRAADTLPIAQVGKQYNEVVVIPFRGHRQVVLRVVEAIPNVRVVTEGALPAILPRMEITISESRSGACEVDWRMFSRSTTRHARWTFLPLVRCLVQKRARAGMSRLREQLTKVNTAAARCSLV